MSSLVFTTRKDSPYDVEIAGAGMLAGNARGGIPVDDVAKIAVELHDKNGEPLTGRALEKAADEFAQARGLAVKSLKAIDDRTRERLRVEAGAFPRGKSIEEVSREAAERDGFYVEQHETNLDAAPLQVADLPPQETSVLPQPLGTEG